MILLCAGPGSTDADGTEPFTLSWRSDAATGIAGLASMGAGELMVSRMHLRNPDTLNIRDIRSPDRFAAGLHSRTLDRISDYTFGGTLLVFGLTLAPHTGRGGSHVNLLTDLVMFLEVQSLTRGLTRYAKGLGRRARPYAYNDDLPRNARGGRKAFLSFWSAHASHSFATAVYTAYVFGKRNPGSRYTTAVWAGGITCASTTAVLRVLSGQHFPTDVLAGAAAGALIGWAVPFLHRTGPGSGGNLSFDATTGMLTYCIPF